MEYLKEAATQYPHHVLNMQVRTWGVFVTMKGSGFTADHAFSWDEIDKCHINPITNWADQFSGFIE